MKYEVTMTAINPISGARAFTRAIITDEKDAEFWMRDFRAIMDIITYMEKGDNYMVCRAENARGECGELIVKRV